MWGDRFKYPAAQGVGQAVDLVAKLQPPWQRVGSQASGSTSATCSQNSLAVHKTIWLSTKPTLRRSVEFQWFLIALSVRPFRCCAMRAHCARDQGHVNRGRLAKSAGRGTVRILRCRAMCATAQVACSKEGAADDQGQAGEPLEVLRHARPLRQAGKGHVNSTNKRRYFQ